MNASDALAIHREITAATRRYGVDARVSGKFPIAPTARKSRVSRAA